VAALGWPDLEVAAYFDQGAGDAHRPSLKVDVGHGEGGRFADEQPAIHEQTDQLGPVRADGTRP
jgi:hypothetical protein